MSSLVENRKEDLNIKSLQQQKQNEDDNGKIQMTMDKFNQKSLL